MRKPLLVLLLATASTAFAAGGPFSTKQFGPGYTHPNAEAGDYLENGHKVPEPKQPTATAPDSARPLPTAPVAAPAPRVTPKAPVSAAPARQAPVIKEKAAPAKAEATKPAAAPSLWNGLVRPMNGAQPAAAPAASGDESATADGAAQYDGSAAAPALTMPGAAQQLPASPALDTAAPAHDSLFVSIEVDPGEAGTLRDAVAGLGATGFSADPRFEARQGPGRASIITGWLPAARLGDAVIHPGVKKVSIETSSRPAPREAEVEGDFLLGLRVPDASKPEESIAPALGELAKDAGLKNARVLGLETAPDGRAVAVVSARLPLSRLSRALGRADVIKLVPAPAQIPLVESPRPAPAPSASGFARFMARRGLWLVLLTVALAFLMPATRSVASKGVEALNPYH